MAHIAQQRFSDESTDPENFRYPEPDYPYIYARSVAASTPAVSHAPLPPPSMVESHSAFIRTPRRVPQRALSDSSQSSGGDSFITPSLSASQVGNRMRPTAYARSHASQPRSHVPSFVSREDLRQYSRPPTAYAPSKPPTVMSPPRPPTLLSHHSHHSRPPTVLTATSPSTRPSIRRLRSALKKSRPSVDDTSYTSSSSTPDIIADHSTYVHESPYIHDSQTLAPSPQEATFPVIPVPVDSPSEVLDSPRSRVLSTVSPSVVIQKTRFHGGHGSAVTVSRHLARPWDARSPLRLDSAARAAPAFDTRGINSIQLIVAGLPWSVHVRPSRSRSRSRSSSDQITVGDVIDSIYASLNKSLTRSDVRAATNETKKRIARAAAAAERESQRGEQSARTGKPCAARRIDFLGSRVWFMGLEKNDAFARREGYGATEQELQKRNMPAGLACFASVSRASLLACRVGLLPPLTVRSFSSTPPALAKISSPGKKKRKKRVERREINPEAMPITEATHAVEFSPISAYELHIKTQYTRGQAALRGRVALPHDPRIRREKVLVFADGKAAQDALQAGAAHVGGAELIPARGTVTEDVVAAIREAQGTIEWKADKNGYIHAAVGRRHFPVENVERNVRAFLQTVREAMAPEDEAFATRKKTGMDGWAVSIV
ncbi:hypothetical protein CTheo_1504 [Ceratobasidium theobromae]|uniref:DUF6699 domain-containing protein n=1 Tax=Ceratobasidium theobromae TaxID=1582974 RepID=A0A5N5QU09_9AGAM|nr:hypothetical protein CTheo_1504 [Ceratobasidium theobromae]